MEDTGLARQREEDTSVNRDAMSWSRLEPGICDMILEKLPYLEHLRLRVVCKDWNCSALKRVQRNPYFVTITALKGLHRESYSLNGLVVYDVVSKSLSFEDIPFKLLAGPKPCYEARFAVEGLIFCYSHMVFEHGLQDQWCVYNIHTRTTSVVPSAPGSFRENHFCGMMVDTSVKPHTFKLVVSFSSGQESQIYDSGSRSWSLHPNSNPNSNSSLLLAYKNDWLQYCMCHKGCMYMSSEKAVEGVLVYSMEKDQWRTLGGSPFRGERRPWLGAWDDRIFVVLHDAEARGVTVWELLDETQQEWVEYAHCSKAQYEQLSEHTKSTYHCSVTIVSVFCEEYVLMYNRIPHRSDGLLLLNLKSREWEAVAGRPDIFLVDDEVEDVNCYGAYSDGEYDY